MEVTSFQVAQARAAIQANPVSASFEYRTGGEWYSRDMMDQYPSGTPNCDPFPLLYGQLASAVKNDGALYRLMVLAAGHILVPTTLERVLPFSVVDPPVEYQDVIMRRGPYAAIPVDPTPRTVQEKATLAMYCFIFLRAIVKDETYMARMPEKARDIIRGVYTYESPFQALLDPLQLRGYRDFLRVKDPVVMGLIRAAVEAEHQAKLADTLQAKRVYQVLNAGLLLNLRYYGYGALTMFLRMNQKIKADINRMLEGFVGTAYASAVLSIIFVMVVYMEPDAGRRQVMIESFGIDGAPPADQIGWQYGRVFKEDCMNIVASKTHDTFISLCLGIYNAQNPENPIRNYRALSSGVSKEYETAFVTSFQRHFASGFTGQERGFLAATVEELIEAGPARGAIAPAAAQARAPAAPANVVVDEDI